MNRNDRRRHNALMSKLPIALTPVDKSEWPEDSDGTNRYAVWRSRKYLVQLFAEPDGIQRMTVCRVTVGQGNRWNDDIAWDELQQIKHDVGCGDKWAVEIYPPAEHIVNVANMRHLWLQPRELSFGWRNNA